MATDVILQNSEEEDSRHGDQVSEQLKEKQVVSSQKLQRFDSLDIESRGNADHRHSKEATWSVILTLAFQSIGVVYGDLGTSPLYVFSSTFPDGIKDKDDILGVLSLILYTVTLIPLIKYVLIVLQANDNGEGGTFALYSLLCRYAKISLTPSQQAEDSSVSNFKLEVPSRRLKMASKLKSTLESSQFAKVFLLFATLLGTSMVIGDGVLTPCISVLSAVVGIKGATSAMTEDMIVWISVAILIILFMIQRFGTDKVGYSFAPILCIWFLFIGVIGIYNFIRFDPTVIKAINPRYIVEYFTRNKKEAWISLGGVVLCITGAEALFADVGHFTVRSIQISTCAIVYPSVVLAYIGQASFLRQHADLVADTFFKSIPGPLYWPMFVVAVLASIIASQSLISATFSIIQQSQSLRCFPRVKVVHTSSKYQGQVYIPEVNYILMLACVGVTLAFRTTTKIGNALGIAVVFVMMLTSLYLILIMIMIWKTHILLVISYILIIGSMEVMYLSSVLYKFEHGGYLPLVFAILMVIIMFVWNEVYRRMYYYEVEHKVSPDKFKQIIIDDRKICRMPGLAIFYSEFVHGIPPIFNHYVANVPALHTVLIFVSIKHLPISKISIEERFLFRRVEPKELNVFRCVARYGYRDLHNVQESFEELLIKKLKEFVKDSCIIPQQKSNDEVLEKQEELHDGLVDHNELVEIRQEALMEVEVQLAAIDEAWSSGVIHLIGENEVIAAKGSGIAKRIMIDYAYSFVKKNLRQSGELVDIPRKRMLKVGMTYEL
ncbi:potassium transporter 5-like [Argentina anserina]|uniref:potassium transporter 5-like n=1 Tax=Argentina anserina TaxID=57926 RepID=UPI0021767410|nr:potassium transporter 5-like [Potentilla anserina]